jgi:hypothetical protein
MSIALGCVVNYLQRIKASGDVNDRYSAARTANHWLAILNSQEELLIHMDITFVPSEQQIFEWLMGKLLEYSEEYVAG